MNLATSLNFAVPIAVCRACLSFGVKEVGIKWPNDILVRGKKLSGILLNGASVTETEDQKGHFVAHLGVGINVNEDMTQNSEVSAIATSIASEMKMQVSREQFLATFFNILELDLLPLSWAKILVEYGKHDLLKGKLITIAPKQRESLEGQYQATAVRFSDKGYLVVKDKEGKELSLIAEEVMIRGDL